MDSIITRLVDDPAANAAKWKTLPYLMDYEDPALPSQARPSSPTHDYARRPQVAVAHHRKLRPWQDRDHGTGAVGVGQMSLPLRRHCFTICSGSSYCAGCFRYPRPRDGFRPRRKCCSTTARSPSLPTFAITVQPGSLSESRSSYPWPRGVSALVEMSPGPG